MRTTVFIGYHKKESFCYNGILKTIEKELLDNNKKIYIVDLYDDDFNPSHQNKNKELVNRYQNLIIESSHIIFITPVWWFRCTSMLEGFFDQVFTPGFAYEFKSLTKTYGIPIPLLTNKKVIGYMTHGAPALPVLTLYLNAVKLRLLLGVFSFCFNLFKVKIRQFFSVPFCSQEKRERYLLKVKKDIQKEIIDLDSRYGTSGGGFKRTNH